MNRMTKKHSHQDLEALYLEAETCDSGIFSEMRSNVLLISGEHYNKRNSPFFKSIRDSKELSEQQKLRLTKNHIQKIVKLYCNNITSLAPGVGFEPKNQNELKDQKSAELHHAVWQDAKDKYNLDEKVDDWCDDFVGIGEVITKIFWDPQGGKILGRAQAVDEAGNPQVDEFGRPLPGDNYVYSGEFVFEDVYGFNFLRAPETKDMRKSPYGIIRKMVDKDELLARFADKKSFIVEGQDETARVFDATKGGYRHTAKNEVLVKEFFFRPCPLYPMGYCYISTKEGILYEGELPGGIWPIAFQPWDKIQTTPRGRGPVKIMRPYQAEINRAFSKVAEHQITLGDDKLILTNGSKASSGASLPGIRTVTVTGGKPEVLMGRDGSQYSNYGQMEIAELYKVMMVDEDSVEKQNGQLDPYALLFRAASQKKRFSRYVRRFERFLIEVARIHNSLAKIHLPDDAVVYAVGRPEQVNISEFKNAEDICYQIKISAQSDDIETKMGKQLVLNHLIQYAGAQLGKEELGALVELMPYANIGEGTSDLTLDRVTANNDILALDRGERPMLGLYDNHPYMIKKLTNRMRKADFKFLSEEVQSAYAERMQVHMQAEALVQQEIQRAKAGYIPTTGYLVSCDFYQADPKDTTKTRRVRLPADAVQWLIKQLETQGQSLEQLESMNEGALAELSRTMLQQRRGALPDGMGGAPTPQPLGPQASG